MQPVLKTIAGTAVGTAAFVVVPDIFQNPFSIAWAVSIPTGAATYTLQATTDWSTVMLPTWDGSSTMPSRLRRSGCWFRAQPTLQR